MQQKKVTFKIKGMKRDLSVSAFDSQYSYENQNIRIMNTDENTLLSVINERGTQLLTITGDSTATTTQHLEGTPLGQAVINDYAVVFTHSQPSSDYIYKISFGTGETAVVTLLYSGNLGFNTSYPIETIVSYENANIQKVYWTDGLNQPRVINIAGTINANSDTQFDFVRTLQLNEDISISRVDSGQGVFPSGVIQYALTYYSTYMQETNIFYASPLFYTSLYDRGGKEDETMNNCFQITVSNVDTNFDCLRIYSIMRTSIDGMPQVKKIVDISTGDGSTVNYTDTGTMGETVDSTQLLYTGGQLVSFKTFNQKDNRLFIGNFKLTKPQLSDNAREWLNANGSNMVYETDINWTQNTSPTVSTLTKGKYYYYNNQLKLSSDTMATFKQRETYRLGIQLQDYTGQWSEPVFIQDHYISGQRFASSAATDSFGSYPIPYMSISPDKTITYIEGGQSYTKNIVQYLIDSGYKKVRPVIVYPSFNDRSVVCQGVVCPTVYNVGDRKSNSPFVQSSWFARPCSPIDVGTNLTLDSFNDIDDSTIKGSLNSIGGSILMAKTSYTETVNNVATTYPLDPSNLGKWSEFRHNYSVGGNKPLNGEIQCLENAPLSPYIVKSRAYTVPQDKTDYKVSYSDQECNVNSQTWSANCSEYYFIDQSIFTLHSPEIEFDDIVQNMNMSDLRFRIIGYVPLTSCASDIDIQTSTPSLNYTGLKDKTPGFYKETVGSKNMSVCGWRQLISGAYWLDDAWNPDGSSTNTGRMTTGYVVYPWHRDGSLNNTKYGTASTDQTAQVQNNYKSARLKKKIISNLRYSYDSRYFNDSATSPKWEAYEADSSIKTGISQAVIFNSDVDSIVKIKAPENSVLNDIVYKGNIDKVIMQNSSDYLKYYEYGLTEHYNNYLKNANANTVTPQRKRSSGYVIYNTKVSPAPTETSDTDSHFLDTHEIFSETQGTDYLNMVDNPLVAETGMAARGTGVDAVSMKYKSTPHAVIALNYTTDHKQRVLPRYQLSYLGVENSSQYYTSTGETVYYYTANGTVKTKTGYPATDTVFPFWEDQTLADKCIGVVQDAVYAADYQNPYGFLLMGELYRPSIANRFGGNTQQAYENNVWLPCGEAKDLVLPTSQRNFTINWTQGDTYYQRYDCLRTYPYTNEDTNQIVDIVSFMCETHINIDGRSDKNRGNTSNLTANPTNFNLINKVYSQQNNYFNYNGIDHQKPITKEFNNSISWTLSKNFGELVDKWTNITMASTMDFDGDRGGINSIQRLNNSLIVFQDKGISQLLFNEKTQLSTTDGVPIELANSGTVDGKRYITNQTGCQNKWSICTTPEGIYFIDDITKDMFLMKEGSAPISISDKLGFHSWINKISNGINIWNPTDFGGIKTYYDKVNGDVFFTTYDQSLAFNETLGLFTSFYSYQNTPYFFNLGDRGMFIGKNRSLGDNNYYLWGHNEGDYNMFFNSYSPFYTTYIVNPEITQDKIFNNIEFSSDSWNKDTDNEYTVLMNDNTFDSLNAWNEYQGGSSTLLWDRNKVSNLKKKFRIWRANIPRDTVNSRDRIRNPWIYLKLAKNTANTYKTILHDVTVDYFE